MHIIVPNV